MLSLLTQQQGATIDLLRSINRQLVDANSKLNSIDYYAERMPKVPSGQDRD